MALIVGISALHHDSACCILREGRLLAAAEEERFTRRKYDGGFPEHALRYCLEEAGAAVSDIDVLAFFEHPDERHARQLATWFRRQPPAAGIALLPQHLQRSPKAHLSAWLRERVGYAGEIRYVNHHLSHAACAFYLSGFRHSAVLTVDAVGEWETSSYAVADTAHGIDLLQTVPYPHSLGMFYSAVTSFVGFSVNSGEFKLMGLAPYGEPRFIHHFSQMVTCDSDGQLHLNLDYFDLMPTHPNGRIYTAAFADLLGVPSREHHDQPNAVYCDIACSAQRVLERCLVSQANHARVLTGSRQLCLGGGVALNCVANAAIRRAQLFDDLFVPPAPGDAGGALGAAWEVQQSLGEPSRSHVRLPHAFWGPRYTASEAVALFDACGVPYTTFPNDAAMYDAVASDLQAGQVVAWFYGRMEFGPRALGHRSILADPRPAWMRDHINALIKEREGFRPFAPAVLAEHADQFFNVDIPMPFMTETSTVKATQALPAVTHVDTTARLQTVCMEDNPRFYQLLQAFYSKTKIPVLLNTSFNLRDEPIVCSPHDALSSFARSRLDVLVVEGVVVRRADLPDTLVKDAECLHDEAPSKISTHVYAEW